MPDLSIVIITYNRSALLERTLASLHASPLRDCEIWILNNASTDHTAAVAAAWQARFPSLRLVTHPVNIGGNANILRAHEYGTATYRWVLCDDDDLNFSQAGDLLEALAAGSCDLIRVAEPGVEPAERGTTRPLGELLEDPHGSAFYSLGFVPGVIVRTEPVKPQLLHAYWEIRTCYPQVFLLARSFPPSSLVYTTRTALLRRGTEPTGLGCEIHLYWLLSLRALPTKRAVRRAERLILRHWFAFGRRALHDVRNGRSRREVLRLWGAMLGRAPSLRSAFIVALNLPFLLIPRWTIRMLYPILRRKPCEVSNFYAGKAKRQ